MAETLSQDDFRKALYESLSKKGIVSSFKSHLRQQIAIQLSRKTKGEAPAAAGSALVSDMLTAAHLKFASYEYSLSTFLSEANLSDKNLSMCEWLRLLNVAEDSALSRCVYKEDKVAQSPLLSFLNAVVLTCGLSVENIGVQTEAVSLQDKLQQLDEKYSNLSADRFGLPQDKQLHNIMIENKNVQDIVKLEVERFKELEMERYKLLEKDRLNKEFNTKLADFEEEYRQRLDSLHKREVESSRAHDTMKSETEAMLYKDRQMLLSELESLRSRSRQLEREHDVSKQQVELEREKFAVLSARLEERNSAISQKEQDFKNRLQDHLEKARLQCKAELRDRESTITAKESQLQDQVEERARMVSDLQAQVEELKKIRKENYDLNDRLMLLEAQLDAARAQTLHYEAKLAVTSDYEQIKHGLVSMETERRHLLENIDKDRNISKYNEDQLQLVISSLRGQLSRPSVAESEAVNELTKHKHDHFRESEDLKRQLTKVQNELEREQTMRINTQKELRDQFMECRTHHTVETKTKPNTTEFPDFLKKYLSSVTLDETDFSDNSGHVTHSDSSSSDSYLRPTKSLVASSQKLFAQLEQEEKELEREFANFKHRRHEDFPCEVVSGMYKAEGEPPRTVKFDTRPVTSYQAASQTTKSVMYIQTSESDKELTDKQSENKPQTDSSQSTITPRRNKSVSIASQKSDDVMMVNLDPVMQGYLNRVIEEREGDKSEEQERDNTSNIAHEQVQFDKTDSDFSW